MNFKHIVLSALVVLSAEVHADSIGWGNNPGNPGNPNRPTPSLPERPMPSQPSQPSFPSQPSRPSQPSMPSQPRLPNQPSFPSQPSFPTQPSFPSQPSFPTQPSAPSFPSDPWGNGNSQSQSRGVEENIQKYFDGFSALDLVSDYYIRSQLQGLKIRDITIVASSEQGQGRASLVLNGQSIESSQTVVRQVSSYTFRVDQSANVIGQSLRTIELGMQGRFYVEKVIFNMLGASGPNIPGPTRPPEGQQNEVIRQQLNERIQQEGGLELYRMFNLNQDRLGQSIKRVTVIARSPRGQAIASLLVNNQQTSSTQYVNSSSSRLSFELSQGSRIGQEIQSLKLYFRGDVVIEEVSIEIEKRNSGGGGGPYPNPMERRFEQVINQRLYDTNGNGVALRSLMQIPSRFDERLVDSVELTLRNSDMGVRVKLCQVLQDQFQSVNCGVPSTISSGYQTVRLSSVNFAKLRELNLSTRMGMIDIDRIVINFK